MNTHWHGSKLWQATIYEGQFITFKGVTDLDRNNVVPEGAGQFLRRLIKRRAGKKIRTSIQPQGTEEFPPQPNEKRLWIFMNIGI